MKNKLVLALLSLCLSTGLAHAQEPQNNERFAGFKNEILGDLNKEKSVIDQAIACVNSASKTEDMKKCQEQRKASMDSLRQARDAAQKQRMAQRKEMLQKEMNEIDQKMNQKQPQ